jgi:hypothetical protein
MRKAVNGRLELAKTERDDDTQPLPQEGAIDQSALRAAAQELARKLAWLPAKRKSRDLGERCRSLSAAFHPLLTAVESPTIKNDAGDLRTLRESIFLLDAEMHEICQTFDLPHNIPQVRVAEGDIVSRVAAIANGYLTSADHHFSEAGFSEYIDAFQEITVLKMAELWMLIPVLKLELLEQIARRGSTALGEPAAPPSILTPVRSLEDVKQANWKNVIEPLIVFDRVLLEDPSGAYPRMDYDSRDLYRKTLVNIAEYSDTNELKVAHEILQLAREAQRRSNADPRLTLRASHVGFYLLAEGSSALEERVGFQPPFIQRFRANLRKYPNEFYLTGIAVLTCAIVSAIVLLLTKASTALGLVLLALLAVLLPSSQSAVQIMNYLITLLLPARILPKLDFSEGLPDDCVTLVAIPTMLLNEKQVRKLAEDLEVRYFGNRDPNVHFALLTDLPDSPFEPVEDHALVDLAADLINGLNQKYADKEMGSFFLLHRHRVYNPRERLWMGWERKRGKLMDLNNLLRGQFDSFPVKTGDLPTLSTVRFVITLDSDTELPRQSAKRMVGTLAHPLNQAIIDPQKGTVVKGYGLLQPRVEVSVQSTARSRLASIYSGQTGLDIYTHATSDVYQDLYEEGIFVGKGIYEVETLHRVLHGRFPRNALLSHDLIEGAYARAGLASDIEVIEDYPSHYSAHNRRKHRWLRGDWQITEWLLPHVPEESGRRVPNPLSTVSRWKILDNLRRSLFEPALFILFVLAWVALPGSPLLWTIAIIVVLFLPALCQLVYDLLRALAVRQRVAVVNALNSFLNAAIANWLTVTFLAHQTLLSIDAVVRTMVRRLITRERLLEWETAAEAEMAGEKRTMLDIYLNWTPALAFGVFLLVWFVNRNSLIAAAPILVLWAASKPISVWLNQPPRAARKKTSERNRWMLRTAALRTWRYFAEFSTAEHNWLIPDNVQEDETKVAPRVSPTNLGLLFNVRQVACELGYLTISEFAQLNLRTLATVSRMRRLRGHLLNWYDTQSLAPLSPETVSSVDSGNLVASLWTLRQGCLDLLKRPLLQPQLASGILDHLYLMVTAGALDRRKFSAAEKALKGSDWLLHLLTSSEFENGFQTSPTSETKDPKNADEVRWFEEQLKIRIQQVAETVNLYAPWLLSEFASLREGFAIEFNGDETLEGIPNFIDNLENRLHATSDSADRDPLAKKLLALLPDARSHVVALIDDLTKVAEQSGKFADEMDFAFLLIRQRQMLSIGFELDKQQLHPACYDLLASEARIAYFIAIAKGDIPQDSWFLLARVPTADLKTPGLLSWTGTMFEYLMPALWMRIYPNTLLERAAFAAVRLQQAYAASKRVPWGISESAYAKIDPAGNYSYFAFGVPELAIHKPEQDGPVISPYSTFLALNVDPPAALRNLRAMQRNRWLGAYGFYESLDFTPKRSRSNQVEVVRCWMAHHQGMSLLSIANFLSNETVQRWFHNDPRVQATELLLQEKPLVPVSSTAPRRVRTEVA